VVSDDFVPADHMCRVMDAFVEKLVMSELGFERAYAGRLGCNPRDLLKLYLYSYLNQIRSSRRLKALCRCNVELMWLPGAYIRTAKAPLAGIRVAGLQGPDPYASRAVPPMMFCTPIRFTDGVAPTCVATHEARRFANSLISSSDRPRTR
jgi:hypothetical protein